jgi:hypothetical protein
VISSISFYVRSISYQIRSVDKTICVVYRGKVEILDLHLDHYHQFWGYTLLRLFAWPLGPLQPLPLPKYKLSEGNATPAAIWQQCSAINVSRGTPSSPMPTTPLPSQPGPTMLLVPSFGTKTPYDNSSHEMRVRTPSQYELLSGHFGRHVQRTPSQMSYVSNGTFATANDDFLSEDDRGTINTMDYQLRHGQQPISHVLLSTEDN